MKKPKVLKRFKFSYCFEHWQIDTATVAAVDLRTAKEKLRRRARRGAITSIMLETVSPS